MSITSVAFAGMTFKNPLLLSAADHTHSLTQLKNLIDQGAGGIIPKTLCQFPYLNDQVEIARYMILDECCRPVRGKVGRSLTFLSRGGMMREDEGWMEDLARAQEYARASEAHIIGSLWGEADWMAEKAAGMERLGLSGVELDIGCPHLDGIHANESMGVADFMGRCRQLQKVVEATRLPVIVKMGADIGASWEKVVRHLRKMGVAGLTVHNRFVGFLPDIETQKPFMDAWSGVGGPWTLPITCYRIDQVRRLDPTFPVMATNGGFSGEDVARFLLAGASVAACASAPMIQGPGWVRHTLEEFTAYLERKETTAQDLIGRASDAALSREELFRVRKKAVVDRVACVKCGICAERCPWEAITMTEEGGVQIAPWQAGVHRSCKGCGMCAMLCPRQALRLEER